MMNIAVLIGAAIHTLLIESVYLWSVGVYGYKAIVGLSLSFVLWCLLFKWICVYSRSAPFIIAAIVCVELLCLYATINYKVYIDANSFAFLAETNFAEAEEFVGRETWLWLSMIVGLTLATYVLVLKVMSPRVEKENSIIRFIAPAFLIGMASLMNVRKTSMTEETLHYPLIVELPMASVVYARQKIVTTYKLLNRSDFKDVAFKGPEEDLEAVLIIGESARGRSFSLNGYSRNTNPELSLLDVVSFRRMKSCAASTRMSVPCLVTAATLADPLSAASKISFVSGFKALGFSSTWFSSHRVSGDNDSLIKALSEEADRQIFSKGSYKTRTDVPILKKILAYLDVPDADRRLTVIHSIGSHWRYANRYASEFGVFQPVCEGSVASLCDPVALVNGYDNSIVATDHLIASVIRKLEGRNAFVIYTADHGESLGEDGNYNHGKMERPEQREVPFIFWASKKFRERYPDRIESVYSHEHDALTHDYIFHSMLNCAGIQSKVVNSLLSICGSFEKRVGYAR